MTPKAVKLRISPPVGSHITPGRGFYQIEEDSLYVQVGIFKTGQRYFSHLESEYVHLEFDGSGQLIFIEVTLPRRRWSVNAKLIHPAEANMADVRWLNFRETISEPNITSNKSGTIVRLLFSSEKAENSFRIAENIYINTSVNKELISLWITEIIDDKAGLELAAFRHSCNHDDNS